MPAVSEQFKTFYSFASANLDDIYGERLTKAFKVTANHLKSGIWLNESSKDAGIKFSWKSLPRGAQLSPVNSIASGDFNSDGKIELIFAQNHFTNWPETGLWRGSPGCHMEWSNNAFKVIPQKESGINLPNDTKSILSIDIDGDGSLDIIAGQNNDELLIFKNNK